MLFHKLLGLFSHIASLLSVAFWAYHTGAARCGALRKACVAGSERHPQSSLHQAHTQMPVVQQAVSATERGEQGACIGSHANIMKSLSMGKGASFSVGHGEQRQPRILVLRILIGTNGRIH